MSNAEDVLNALRAEARKRAEPKAAIAHRSWGERAADTIASVVGSWKFIVIQSALLAAWILFNAVSAERVDPYPFILLNLLLSFQAAYTAPIIMMSQNRQSDIDRRRNVEWISTGCEVLGVVGADLHDVTAAVHLHQPSEVGGAIGDHPRSAVRIRHHQHVGCQSAEETDQRGRHRFEHQTERADVHGLRAARRAGDVIERGR